MRMALWLTVGGVGLYVWQRGFDQSVEDFGYIWGFLLVIFSDSLFPLSPCFGGRRTISTRGSLTPKSFRQGLGDEGERIGGQKARGRERDARRMAGAGKRGRTRGAGWQ